MNKGKTQNRKNNGHRRLAALLAGLCALAMLADWGLDRAGIATLGAEPSEALRALRISEVQNNNALTLKGDNGDAPGWIELENTGTEPLSLHGVCLTRDTLLRKTLVLPDITLTPGECVLVYADGGAHAMLNGKLHAPFKLPKSGGTALYLYDASNHLLDSLTVPTMQADEAYARDAQGEWAVVNTPTPGAPNDRYTTQAAGAAQGDVAVSEVMTGNANQFPDENGAYWDYIEVRNLTDRAVNLKGYCLTDNAAKPGKFVFPNVTLPANGCLAVHCSGENRVSNPAHLHAAFKLSKGETVYLIRGDGVTLSEVPLPALKTGQAYSWVDNEGWTKLLPPTPNMENTVEAAIALDDKNINRRQNGIYISEVMAIPSDDKADWVEICNATGTDVNLSGCGLSDQIGRPRRWQFPQGTVLPAGERTVVFLVGDGTAPANYLSAPFALSGEGGEMVSLSDPSGALMDALYLPAQYLGASYGRDASGKCGYFESGTPLKANGTALKPPAAGVTYSKTGGLFHTGDSFSVTLSAPSGTIYYTLDCSDPDRTKTRYSGEAIPVSGTTILRTRVYADGCLPSIMDTQSYLYDVNAASDAPYVVSLVSDPTGLYSDETGIMVPGPNAEAKFPYGDYNRGANFWMDWEREAHVELFTGSGQTAVSQECGIKLHGRNTRAYELKSFTVMAKPRYGSNRFRYPIFHERPWDEYEAFILRYSGQDYKAAFMRDVVMTNQAAYTSVMYMEAEECIVYLNGKYYSAMYIREYVGPFSLARREGWAGQEDSLDLVKSGYEEKQGSNASYLALKEYLKTHDNASQETYDYIAGIVDIDNFIEFTTLQVVYGPPDTVNVKRYRNPDADGKWRWVVYDFDRALRGGENSQDGFELMAQGTNAYLFMAFMQNPTLRDRFLDYLNQALSTFLSSQSLTEAAEAQLQRILPLLPDYLNMMEISEKNYKSAYKNFLSNIKTRPALVLQHCAKYLNLSQEEMNTRFAETYAAIAAFNG